MLSHILPTHEGDWEVLACHLEIATATPISPRGVARQTGHH